MQEMVTSQPNSQNQQSTKEIRDTSLMDSSHEEAVIEANEFKTKDVQPHLISDLNEVQPNLEIVLVT